MKSFNLEELRYEVLSILDENGPLTQGEIVTKLQDRFDLNKEERNETTKTGQKKFYKTVAGQEQLLKKAGLIHFGTGEKKFHSITESGRKKLFSNDRNTITTTDMKMTVSSGLISHQGREIKHYNSIAENGCTMLIIPRKEYHRDIDKEILSEYPCLYILSNGRSYYIGYSGNAFERIYVHSRPNKEPFTWTTAYVFLYTDKDDNSHINIADAAYLEYLAFQKADYSKTVNHKGADSPYMKRTDKTKMDEVFTDIAKLLEKSNVDVFKR